jgi:hypothetical protein
MKMIRSKKRRAFRLPLLLSCALGFLVFSGAPMLEGKTIAFPEMSGWKQDGKAQIFSPKTLYEYINGAADLYLAYEFQDLRVAEYKGEKKAGVTVEVYRHKTPTQAFGIYSQERLANAKFLDIGAQGYHEPNVLNFLTGPYYVKINGFNTGEDDEKVLMPFAKKVEEILGGKTLLPQVLSSFPQEGMKKNTEKFIFKNFLGYSFLHSGYTADYEVSGKKFKIFVIEGKNREDCREMIEKYLRQTGNQNPKAAEGTYGLKDSYHGPVDLLWKGKFIWGILNLEDPALRTRYLKLLESSPEGSNLNMLATGGGG